MAKTETAISILTADEVERRVEEFAALLHACVHAGASINFVMPYSAGGRAGRTDRRIGAALDRHAAQPAPSGRGDETSHPSGLPPPGHRPGADGRTRRPGGASRPQPDHPRHAHRRQRRAALRVDGLRHGRRHPRLLPHAFVDRLDATTIMYKAL